MPPSSLLAGFPHQLNADMHLLYWLDQKGFGYDIVTDHELHYEGQAVLAPYRTVRPTRPNDSSFVCQVAEPASFAQVLTGSHPEYWTGAMLTGLDGYEQGGGRLCYLGGNGLYWITSIDPERPWMIEIRRNGGTQAWEAAPGECEPHGRYSYF